MDFCNSILDVSKIYCQSALNSQMPTGGSVHLVGGIRVALVRGTLPSTSAQEIKEVDSNYTGAQLILASVPEVRMHVVYFCLCIHV